MEEVRKEIPWLPKWKYFVSNLGRVKNWNVKNRKWRILKFESNRYWHQRVKLYWSWWRNDVRHYQVHRLVYCVFNDLDYNFGLCEDMSEATWLVCHKDNNPLNNRLDNLYMWTQKENMQQCIDEWRFKFMETRYWEDVHNSKLTEEQVQEIIDRIWKWEKQNDLAEEFWVAKSTINAIRKWRIRKHVARKTSDEFGGTPVGTIPSQASQGWDEGVTTNSIPLGQWWSWHERPTSSES